MPKDKTCFVIAPIGEDDSDTRKRSDQVLNHIIKPAAEDCGYNAIRADEIDRPGIITSQVIQHVVNDPLVVADLTERNPNVFYELAIRHALRKPLIQLMEKGEQIPFDVAATRTISVDLHDLDSVADAKDSIISQIRELENDPSDIESPISVSLDLQLLRQSEKPEDRSLAELVAAISTMRNVVERNIDDFNRIKSEIDSLPRRIERRFNTVSGPLALGSKRSLPGILDDLMIASRSSNLKYLDIIIISSMLRDLCPWINEYATELRRISRSRNKSSLFRHLIEFREIVNITINSRWFHEFAETRNMEIINLLHSLESRIVQKLDDLNMSEE